MIPSIEFKRSAGSLILRLVLRLLKIDLADFKSILSVTKVIFVTNTRDVPGQFGIDFDMFFEFTFFGPILRLVRTLSIIDFGDFIFVIDLRGTPLFEIIFDKFVESVFLKDHFHI